MPVIRTLPSQVLGTINSNTPLADPVGRQYVRDDREDLVLPGESGDPIGDATHTPLKGLVHRYPDRVLIKITDTCKVYCRFCFRKEMVGKGAGVLSPQEILECLDYIRARPDIREVILTGGDPLTLSNRRLGDLLKRLDTLDQLDIVRLHTRTPLVDPARVDDGLTACLAAMTKPVYIVLHVNHAQEIDAPVGAALKRLSASGAILLSQSVLLKDVNDDAATLATLFRTLLANRVKPYYLHHPDLAPGTSHFRVSIEHGQRIMKELRGRVTGLAFPHYVLDLPGGHGKMPLTPCYAERLNETQYRVEDYHGHVHAYPPETLYG